MKSSTINILIGVALYLGVVAVLLAILGTNREKPGTDNNEETTQKKTETKRNL